MNEYEEMPRRNFDDVRWCTKCGVIVMNGIPTDVRVWVSSDGVLVLPIGGNGNMNVEIGSRIRMSRHIWFICSKGELGTITGLRESKEDTPDSWFVRMDNGSESYIFEGEFEVVKEQQRREPVGAAFATHA